MRILSLFDGISCGHLALIRAGIEVETYYASEIDKYAIQVTQKNFPDTIQLGDVSKIDFTQFIGKIDMIIGGSPCQDLSIAKANRQGLKGARSGLFYKFVEAIRTIQPKYFLLENVASMSKESKDIISQELGVEPVLINSALVSAQQRKRLYWCNWKVEQPEDKGILLKYILENGQTTDKKSRAIISSIGRTTTREYFKKYQGQMIFEPIPCALRNRGEGKKPEFNGTQKANSLTTVTTDSMVCVYQLTQSFNKDDIDKNIPKTKKIDLPDGDYVIRKLTPIECERLQTLPDNYTECVSKTQRYKSIGNGWTVDVIAHIFKELKKRR